MTSRSFLTRCLCTLILAIAAIVGLFVVTPLAVLAGAAIIGWRACKANVADVVKALRDTWR